MRFRGLGIRYRLLLFVLLAFLPLLAAVVGVYVRQYGLARDHLSSEVVRIARMGALEQEQIMAMTRQLLIALSRNPQVREFDSAYANRLFAELLSVYPGYANIGLIGADGMLKASARPTTGPVNLGERSYFVRALAGRDYAVGEFLVGRVAGVPSIIFSLPLLGRGDSIVGILYAAVDLTWLNERETGFAALLPPGSIYLELDQRGTILAHPGHADRIGDTLPAALQGLMKARAPKVIRLAAFDGVPRLYARAILPAGGMVSGEVSVIIGIKTAQLFVDANRILTVGLSTVVAGAVIAFLVIWFGIGSQLLRPIGRILGVIESVGKRDLRARTGLLHGADEIGQIARSVDDMAVALESSQRLLDQERSLLTRIMNSLPDPMYLKDRDGKFVYGNQALADLIGVGSAEELVGKSVCDLASADAAAVLAAAEGMVLESGSELVNIEASVPLERGGPRIMLRTLVPLIDERGSVSGVVGIDRDVTERRSMEKRLRETEEQLVHAQKMEAIGQLAGGIAHDFNNILTGIIGFATLLQGRLESDAELSAHIAKILTASRRAADLTQALLTFSRRRPIELKVLDLNDIVREQLTFLPRVIGENIRLEADLAGAPMWVRADAVQMNQVLMNLVTNARDAMPQGGVISVRTLLDAPPGFAAPGSGRGSFVHLVFSDTGTGMDEKTRERLFEPFFTTKEIGKGTGLGTSIVWGIVNEHHGRILVDTAVGRGTTFHIYLPFAEVVSVQPEAREEPPARRGEETILVADDDPAVRDLIRAVLTGLGYAVIEAGDGEEAVRKLSGPEARPDLAMLDIMMPRMSGPQVREWMRSDRLATRVIYMSGYAPSRATAEGTGSDDAPILLKPFSARELAAAVRAALDSREPGSGRGRSSPAGSDAG